MRMNKMLFLSVWLMIVFSGIVLNVFSGGRKPQKYYDYYTSTNIWYKNPDKILSTNFHRGEIIPIGTKVSVQQKGKEIYFTTESNITYILVHVKRHSSIKTEDLFKRYFAEEYVMAQGSKFSSFSEEEQMYIKNGDIKVGMSKDAVIMAYGYPPSHKTPDLTSDRWYYWESRARRIELYFKDNKLSNIIGNRRKR